MALHNEIGIIGEKIAEKFLRSKGLEIVERNFRKPYGEIDIVARQNTKGKELIRFVEVKSVSYTPVPAGETHKDVPHGTGIRPEENVHPQKLKRLSRVIEAYIISHETTDWVFDLILVYINKKTRSAYVKWLKDIIID